MSGRHAVHEARVRGLVDWGSGCWRLAPERQCGRCDFCVGHRSVAEKEARRRATVRRDPDTDRVREGGAVDGVRRGRNVASLRRKAQRKREPKGGAKHDAVHEARVRGMADWGSGCWRLAPERQCGWCDFCVGNRSVAKKEARRRAPRVWEVELRMLSALEQMEETAPVPDSATHAAAAAGKGTPTKKRRTPEATPTKKRRTPKSTPTMKQRTPESTPIRKQRQSRSTSKKSNLVVEAVSPIKSGATCCPVCRAIPSWPLPSISRGTDGNEGNGEGPALIGRRAHLGCCWETVKAAWVVLCDGAGIPITEVGRVHSYRPSLIGNSSAQNLWDEDDEAYTSTETYDRKETLLSATHFAISHIQRTVLHFKGVDHVIPRTQGCHDYVRSFSHVVDHFSAMRTITSSIADAVDNVVHRVVDNAFRLCLDHRLDEEPPRRETRRGGRRGPRQETRDRVDQGLNEGLDTGRDEALVESGRPRRARTPRRSLDLPGKLYIPYT